MPYSLAVKNKTRAFIDLYGAGIINAIKGTNLFFATVVAQKCLESGYGESSLSKEDFNFGGIKYAPKLTGVIGYSLRDTTEFINGKKVRVKAKFSKFKDAESGIRATIQVLLAERYTTARNTAKTAKEQVLLIAKAGYTTTPPEQYLKALSGIIEATQDYVQIGRVSA
jgi:flagellum-specific peptidoglycan hydrolase FlgJ